MFAGMTFTIFDAVATVVNSINRLESKANCHLSIMYRLCHIYIYFECLFSFLFLFFASNNNNNNNQNINLQSSSNTLVTSNINVANQINVMNMMGKRKRRKKREVAKIAREGMKMLQKMLEDTTSFVDISNN